MLADTLRETAILLLPEERQGVIIFGSSALMLHGVDLGREIDDLDLFVSEAAFKRMASRFELKSKDGKDGEKVPYLEPLEGVEIHQSFPGVHFHDALAHASKPETAGGLLLGSLHDIRKWKIAQGRDKDLRDVEAIDNHLKGERVAC
jgi:hypothetical protein